MNSIPTIEQAFDLLKQYNKDPFHLKHARIVAGVLRYFARDYAPDELDFWEVVGLLHDLDFEQFPDQHGIKSQQIMRELGYDESLIYATASHCYGNTVDLRPKHIMEMILFAADELTGLIGAVTLIRPSRSTLDLEAKSVLKKFKTPGFAAGCSRLVIQRGVDMLGWELNDLIERTILAMRELESADTLN